MATNKAHTNTPSMNFSWARNLWIKKPMDLHHDFAGLILSAASKPD